MKIRNGSLMIKALEIGYMPFNLSRNLRIIYVLKGEVTLQFVAGKTSVKEGQMEIINIEEPVAVISGSEGNIVLLFEFDGTLAKKNQPAIDKALYNCNTTLFYPCRTKNKFQDQLASMLILIYNLFVYTEDNWLIAKTTQEMENLIVEEFHDFKNMLADTGVSEANMSRFLRIYRSIYMNSAGKLNLKEIAEQEYVSVQYLSREFNEKLNINFKSTVEYYKVIQAVRYLVSTNMSITRVSENSGFSAPRYFYKQFYKYLKCTPAEFRANIRSEEERVWEYPVNNAEVGNLVKKMMEVNPHFVSGGDEKKEKGLFAVETVDGEPDRKNLSFRYEKNEKALIEEIFSEACRIRGWKGEAEFYLLSEDEILRLKRFLGMENLRSQTMLIYLNSSRKKPSELTYDILETLTCVKLMLSIASERGLSCEFNWEISGMSESVDSILGYEPATVVIGLITFTFPLED